jgi:hypothetical protein
VTVLVARLAGGFTGGYVGFTALNGHATADALLLVPAAITALATGVAITFLLPGMSGRVIGAGNALTAAFVGAVIPLIAGLAITRGAFTPSAQGALLLGGAAPLLALSASVVGIAVTSWMVSSSSAAPSGWRSGSPESPRSWGDVDGVDRAGAQVEADQAERGYWGSMESPDRGPHPG